MNEATPADKKTQRLTLLLLAALIISFFLLKGFIPILIDSIASPFNLPVTLTDSYWSADFASGPVRDRFGNFSLGQNIILFGSGSGGLLPITINTTSEGPTMWEWKQTNKDIIFIPPGSVNASFSGRYYSSGIRRSGLAARGDIIKGTWSIKGTEYPTTYYFGTYHSKQ